MNVLAVLVLVWVLELVTSTSFAASPSVTTLGGATAWRNQNKRRVCIAPLLFIAYTGFEPPALINVICSGFMLILLLVSVNSQRLYLFG